MAWVPSGTGFHQGLAVNIQNLPPATRDAFFDAFFANTHVAMNITWNNDEWFDAYQGEDWNGTNFGLVVNYGGCDPGGANCGGGAYSPQGFPDIDTGNPDFLGHYDITNYPGVHTRVVEWDYSLLKAGIQAQYPWQVERNERMAGVHAGDDRRQLCSWRNLLHRQLAINGQHSGRCRRRRFQ
jgi:hypothetical protein